MAGGATPGVDTSAGLGSGDTKQAQSVATGTDAIKEPPLPHGHSRWDSLPVELHLHIFLFVGLLTRFINGLLTWPLDDIEVGQLWLDTIQLDWAGDLRLLPVAEIGFSAFIQTRSRSMYHRLCSRLADQSSQEAYAMWAGFLNNYDSGAFPRGLASVLDIGSHLRHVPMRQQWLDLVDFSAPIALAWMAILFDHADLLIHLSQDLMVVDLARFRHLSWPSGQRFHAMDMAAERGHLRIVQLLHEAGSPACSTRAMDMAASNGHLDVVQFLHTHRREGCSTKAMDWASANGHLHVVMWLHANRTEGCTTRGMNWAAQNGHLHVVQWLHTNRTEGCTTGAMDWAAGGGHLHVLQWLHANRSEGCTTYAMDMASGNGHLDVLKWLNAHRVEGCSPDAITWAALVGNLDVVVFLVDHCAQVPSSALIDAVVADNKHQPVIDYLLAYRRRHDTAAIHT